MLSEGKLGFWGLTALVFGLVVGLGIFNLPQNMGMAANPGAVAAGWIVTAVGMIPLVVLFKRLADRYPQYKAGLYQYAQAGFGNYLGFNIAWGYWLCSAFSNVAYGVMLNDAMGAFFPVFLKHSWPTLLFSSVFIWLMFFIVGSGLRTAKRVNTFLSFLKMGMLVLIVVVLVMFFRADLFNTDIWGSVEGTGGFFVQVKSIMMVTLFCFFGVEGAVMMSDRAQRNSDIGKAGITGFLLALVLYLSIALLCYGVMARGNLESLGNPSIAYLLRAVCGDWAYWFVMIAIIISLTGGWVAWTLLVAQVPYEASLVGILPKSFSRLNRHGMPAFGLCASSIAMEVFLLLVVVAGNAYMTALDITGLMVVPVYLFTALFAFKTARGNWEKCLAAFAVLFCCWMAYAGGLKLLLMTSAFYLAGVLFYIRAMHEHGASKVFTGNEIWMLAVLICAAAATVVLLVTG